MSFRDIQVDVESAFKSNEWASEGFPMIPANVKTHTGTDFVRLNVFVPSSEIDGFGYATDIGFVDINIFTKSGTGERRSNEICDALDRLFNGKTLGLTQFSKSTLTKVGEDPEDSQLWRVDYMIPFRRPTTL